MEIKKTIWAKLAQFQNEVQVVPFDAVNPHFKNKYASLAGVVKTCAPVLSKCGLSFSQIFSGGELITILADTETGEKVESILRLPVAETATAQQIGSAITYMKRYALLAILGVVGDDDDDGNEASKTTPPAAPKAQPKQEAKPEAKPELSPAAKVAAIPAAVANLKDIEALNVFWVRCQPLMTEDNEAAIKDLFTKKAKEFGALYINQENKFLCYA